jgi:hypothetical protein
LIVGGKITKDALNASFVGCDSVDRDRLPATRRSRAEEPNYGEEP